MKWIEMGWRSKELTERQPEALTLQKDLTHQAPYKKTYIQSKLLALWSNATGVVLRHGTS